MTVEEGTEESASNLPISVAMNPEGVTNTDNNATKANLEQAKAETAEEPEGEASRSEAVKESEWTHPEVGLFCTHDVLNRQLQSDSFFLVLDVLQRGCK